MLDRTITAIQFFIIQTFWPNNIFGKLGVVLGGISIFNLVIYAINFKVSAMVIIIIDWYDKFLQIVIGWIGVYIEYVLNYILNVFGINIIIEPHWKHIFVLMNVYFLRNSSVYVSGEGKSEKREFRTFLFLSAIGIFISIIFSGIAGSFVANPASFVDNFAIAFSPIIGFVLYDLIERSWIVFYFSGQEAYQNFDMSRDAAYRFYILRIVERLCCSLLIAILSCFFLSNIQLQYIPNPGVFSFLLVTLFLALYWISGRASIKWKRGYPDQELMAEPLIIRLMYTSNTTFLGSMMLGTYLWLLLFLFMNAGLSLAGL